MAKDLDSDPETHRQRHVELHQAFDELIADYMRHHPGAYLGDTSLLELIQWSHAQTQEPTPTPDLSRLQQLISDEQSKL